MPIPTNGSNRPILTVSTRSSPNRCEIALRGELDLGSVAQVEQALASHDADCQTLVLDLSELQFIDSTGLKLLLRVQSSCRERGRELEIRPGPPAVQRVFELTHVDQRLPFSNGG